jgi:hypothetical protein
MARRQASNGGDVATGTKKIKKKRNQEGIRREAETDLLKDLT